MLLTLFVTTPLNQVKQACEDLLRSILATSSFFEHHPSEVEAWLASLPQSDAQSTQSEEQVERGRVVAPHHPSAEQSLVISFLDECMLRCAKTPYRYIEAARQFQQEHGNKNSSSGSDRNSTGASSSTDLLSSPWLMAVFEQFTIRVEKGLFVATDGVVDALMAFFVRFLPVLCAYSRQTSAVEAMAIKIADVIEGNPTYSSATFLTTTLLRKLRSIGTAPERASRHQEVQRDRLSFFNLVPW